MVRLYTVVKSLPSIPIAANAPALLLVGPSFVKPIGKKFNLAPARRVNIMDCAVCQISFTMPWHSFCHRDMKNNYINEKLGCLLAYRFCAYNLVHSKLFID